MRACFICFAVGLAASVFGADSDDGLVSWAKDYPKPGSNAGQILVKGRAKAATGFTLLSASAAVWPRGGGEVKSVKIALNKDGAFGETTISDLDSFSKYNVIVKITETNAAGQKEVRISDPAVVAVP